MKGSLSNFSSAPQTAQKHKWFGEVPPSNLVCDFYKVALMVWGNEFGIEPGIQDYNIRSFAIPRCGICSVSELGGPWPAGTW